MSDWICSCTPRDLLDKGCTCRARGNRSVSIYLALGCIGWQKAWDIMYGHVPNSMLPTKKPTSEDDVVVALIRIEWESPDTFDELARKFEAAIGQKDTSGYDRAYYEPSPKNTGW